MPDFTVGDKVIYDPDAEINKRDGYKELENRTFVVTSFDGEFIYIENGEEHREGFCAERFKLAPVEPELKSGFAIGDIVRCMNNSGVAAGLKYRGLYRVTGADPNCGCGTNCDSLFLKGIDGNYFCSLRFKRIGGNWTLPDSKSDSVKKYDPYYTIKLDGSGTSEESAEPEALVARLRAFRKGSGLHYDDSDKAADLIESNLFVIDRLEQEVQQTKENYSALKSFSLQSETLKRNADAKNEDLSKQLETFKDKIQQVERYFRSESHKQSGLLKQDWKTYLYCADYIDILFETNSQKTPEQIVEDAMRKHWDVQDEVDIPNEYFYAIQVLRDNGMLKEQ